MFDYQSLSLVSESSWCLVGNGWEWGNGMIITSDYGSFPHSLLSTSKTQNFPCDAAGLIGIPLSRKMSLLGSGISASFL